ncbi:uncharacterized protein LOC117116254 [Anneissia japonica]|uniref:uncharacterized protein LOC117116254 n=1 Tax=Anneissia japonica TaxID=1529436 RepID=UPI001425842A|nr:uncharacterized protein LOC117116254 [Anneissia japonica]
MDGEWSKTRGDDSKRFLLYDNGPDTESCITVFATDDHLKVLSNADVWLMDGCFKMAPPGFLQYVIHAPIGEVSVPLVYAFLQRKSQETYEELLNAITNNCDILGYPVDPAKIKLDFEFSAIQAVRLVLGDGVDIEGCFYHLTQSTWRKIQELGIVNHYRTDPTFKHFCGMLDGLAFLQLMMLGKALNFCVILHQQLQKSC